MAQPLSPREQFGPIDIYLFDQILRGRITPGSRILDAGCGSGRNLVYFLRNIHNENYEVYGADSDLQAVAAVRRLAASLAPDLPADNFRLDPVEAMSFPDAFADLVISSAILHFASSDEQFEAMLNGGHLIQPVSGRRHLLPDGSVRYLVDEALLLQSAERLGADLLDPLKTTVVQNQRSMTTWVLRKRS